MLNLFHLSKLETIDNLKLKVTVFSLFDVVL